MKEYNKQNTYQNFNRKNKWMGIIDYKSLLVLVIYMFIIFYYQYIISPVLILIVTDQLTLRSNLNLSAIIAINSLFVGLPLPL